MNNMHISGEKSVPFDHGHHGQLTVIFVSAISNFPPLNYFGTNPTILSPNINLHIIKQAKVSCSTFKITH